ncbi:hypothetical protein B0T14DRAFT_420008 [Immersiella caudata]|uniref:Uncharacterized protein n=1 Tax=Immersiella caudata TaxID=314043 RepID=A0AA40CD64_9PEZI|nr:hypothetical protein B0T14DRAFT_420008 [Immersiella caudata]
MPQLVWLITGCSSGFGEAFISEILSRGDLVIATSRNTTKIAHLAQPGVSLSQLDVTDTQASLNKIISTAITIHGRIDILVNNAGYIAVGSWEDLSDEDLRSQFDTNLFGPAKLTRAVLPHFRARGSGTLVFMGSRSGWYGDPFCGAYAGSKFALEGMAESLRWEVAPFGIRTLLVEPGRFRTGFLSSAGNLAVVESKVGDYREEYERFLKQIAAEDGRQPGDVVQGVRVVVDLVRGEGVAQGRYGDALFRLPLGSDCLETIREKCEDTSRILREWETVVRGTDCEE